MRSSLFYQGAYKDIEKRIKVLFDKHADFMSEGTADSTRAAGDAIQGILADQFHSILGDICVNYSSAFARRAMADLAFQDTQDFYYVIDVKTHRISTKFNMPNLTSIERLARFYEDDLNYFVVLIVAYEIERIRVLVKDVKFIPIEFLGWDCLTIGALGWGQIQISNSNIITINEGYSRKSWMIELCDAVLAFYPKEIAKIGKRIEHFQKVKEFWLQHPD